MPARHARAWRAVALLVALAASAACSKASRPALHALRLLGRDGVLMAQLTEDGAYLDGQGHRVGVFDAAKASVTINGVTIDLNQALHRGTHGDFDLRLPVGTWHVEIASTGDVQVDGKPLGRIDGFDNTEGAQQRAAALIAGVPLLAPPTPTETKPTAPDQSQPRPIPPPPPPPPPIHHGGHERVRRGARASMRSMSERPRHEPHEASIRRRSRALHACRA